MNAIAQIYALSHPVSGEVRYVGKANDTQKRLKSHIKDSLTRNTPVYCWIRSLAAQGLMPIATPILSTWDWAESEVQVIAQYRKDGAKLLNLAEGGPQPLMTTAQASSNGIATAKALQNDPYKKRISQMKRMLSSALDAGELSDYAKQCMKQAAMLKPKIFGAWQAI